LCHADLPFSFFLVRIFLSTHKQLSRKTHTNSRRFYAKLTKKTENFDFFVSFVPLYAPVFL
jgi:hypothetical protein